MIVNASYKITKFGLTNETVKSDDDNSIIIDT